MLCLVPYEHTAVGFLLSMPHHAIPSVFSLGIQWRMHFLCEDAHSTDSFKRIKNFGRPSQVEGSTLPYYCGIIACSRSDAKFLV